MTSAESIRTPVDLVELLREPNGSLESNARIFDQLVSRVLAASKADDTAFWSQAAAHYAWMNHPGRFSSEELERALVETSSTLRSPSPRGARSGGVVHIMTQALQTGGHTRLAWRWIEGDHRRASVVLTAQGWNPIPDPLRVAVASAGGAILDLAARPNSLVGRAARLRRAIASAEVVVQHTHPFDAVAMLALAGWQDRPPVLFMNHADHVFWLGTTSSDAVAEFRASGMRLTRSYRGVDPRRSVSLPLPVAALVPSLSRDDARARLGVGSGEGVVVSVASAYKFEPTGAIDYLEVMADAIRALPHLRVLVVGPSMEGRWVDAARETDGRIQALGIRKDFVDVLVAADIYVDSMPVASLTSLLEAGLLGLPLVSVEPTPGAEILSPDAPGLDSVLMRGATAADVGSRIASLAEDSGLRERLGRETREAIASVSGGEAWSTALELAYGAAIEHRERGTSHQAVATMPEPAILGTSLASLKDSGQGLGAAIDAHLRHAPLRLRVALTAQLARAHALATPAALTPDWIRTFGRPLRR